MIDTHCHIHDQEFFADGASILAEARASGVETLVCIGTSAKDSQAAVAFAQQHQVWAAVAQHPHDADSFTSEDRALLKRLSGEDRVVAIGECGLDFYYNNSKRESQIQVLRWHLELAHATNLPLLFHIRDAFSDFWAIFDEYHTQKPLRGAIHSFSADTSVLNQALERGLSVAYNGIMTFTKDTKQLEALKATPLENMLLETDAPFLTPVPFRGKVNKPQYVLEVAKYIADIRDENPEKVISITTANAKRLLKI